MVFESLDLSLIQCARYEGARTAEALAEFVNKEGGIHICLPNSMLLLIVYLLYVSLLIDMMPCVPLGKIY